VTSLLMMLAYFTKLIWLQVWERKVEKGLFIYLETNGKFHCKELFLSWWNFASSFFLFFKAQPHTKIFLGGKNDPKLQYFKVFFFFWNHHIFILFFLLSSLTCSQIWLKSYGGWLADHPPHKIEFIFF